ncbi:MerR family transcriptional regulator [Desulfosarcina alkanivorans]|uniref:MerR family transcriptional regulator n=1 Tax=Desulfosarcina alkanivorans TaxID=571177 RepID=A0A5K7YMK6_9BACT|nr:MerR family transcriptional regulator [Desulfosarcina alkanivorans]BBO69490.1 MerR family transcriptional regulator [Desulfosarcina alkanivorans]
MPDRPASEATSYRISQLARMFRLSRSTLLYYDRIGLLRPSGRTRANYRIYSHADRQRLEQICRYRRTGMALETIQRILAAPRQKTVKALELRLEALNREIHDLRAQQQTIVNLLKDRSLLAGTRVLDKQRWVAVLRAAGLDDAAMGQWHVAFERMSPEAHQDFLESLGIDAAEIAEIRSWSAGNKG